MRQCRWKLPTTWASLVARMVKNLPAAQETWGESLGGKLSRSREWQPTLVFLPGAFHGQRSLGSYSLCGRKESDTTERLSLVSLSFEQSLFHPKM